MDPSLKKLTEAFDDQILHKLNDLQELKAACDAHRKYHLNKLHDEITVLIRAQMQHYGDILVVTSASVGGIAAGTGFFPGIGTLAGGTIGFIVGHYLAHSLKGSKVMARVIAELGWDPYQLVQEHLSYQADTQAQLSTIPPNLYLEVEPTLKAVGSKLDTFIKTYPHLGITHRTTTLKYAKYCKDIQGLDAAIEAGVSFAKVCRVGMRAVDMDVNSNDIRMAVAKCLGDILARETNTKTQQEVIMVPFFGTAQESCGNFGVMKCVIHFSQTISNTWCCTKQEVDADLHQYVLSFSSVADMRSQLRW